MKTYSNSSNARRAAKVACEKHDNLEVATPVKTDEGYQAAVHIVVGTLPESLKNEVVAVAKDKPAPVPEGEDERTKHTVTNGSRPDAAHQLGEAIGTMVSEAVEKAVNKPKAKASKKAPAKPKAKRDNKTQQAIDLMSRKGGATATELVEKFGWLPHTLRGFVSLQNSRQNRGITTTRKDGVTTYKIG